MEKPNRQRKEKLKEQLELLSDCEQEQIYKIIREYTDQVTFAETGVFVAADVLSPDCFCRVEKYVSFCQEQKKRLDADEAQRSALYKMVHSE